MVAVFLAVSVWKLQSWNAGQLWIFYLWSTTGLSGKVSGKAVLSLMTGTLTDRSLFLFLNRIEDSNRTNFKIIWKNEKREQ